MSGGARDAAAAAVAGFCALVLVAGCGGGNASQATTRPAAVQAGLDIDAVPPCPATSHVAPRKADGLPALTLRCLGAGPAVRLSDLRGTPMVLNIWAAWCSNCADEAPLFTALHDKAGAKLRFFGIHYQAKRGYGLESARDFGSFYPSVQDTDGQGSAGTRPARDVVRHRRRPRRLPPPRGAHVAASTRLLRRQISRVDSVSEGSAAEHPPPWLLPLLAAAGEVTPDQLSRFAPPAQGVRESAILILFGPGEGDRGPTAEHGPVGDVLLIERAHDMRSHPRQVAFPGGAVDPGDDGPVAAALREAMEETGLDPAGVDVVTTLPALFLEPSGFVVTPVLAWWREPSPVSVVDPGEVASVHRVPLTALLDPANRMQVTHPSGYVGAAFRVSGLLVWGFTAGLLDRLLRLAGWEEPWDRDRFEELPPEMTGTVR